MMLQMIAPTYRVEFDPEDPMHRSAVKYFLKNKSWSSDLPKFFYKTPYQSVDAYVKDKLLAWMLENDNETI